VALEEGVLRCPLLAWHKLAVPGDEAKADGCEVDGVVGHASDAAVRLDALLRRDDLHVLDLTRREGVLVLRCLPTILWAETVTAEAEAAVIATGLEVVVLQLRIADRDPLIADEDVRLALLVVEGAVAVARHTAAKKPMRE